MEQIIMQDQTVNDDRILYLSADVTGESISDICKQILQANETDKKGLEKYKTYAIKPIQLHIQSFGGSVYDMWALIDVIEASTTPIITFCNGYCMSAAALIFLSGHYRCMYKHSAIMFHQVSSFTFGKVQDLTIHQDVLEDMHKDMIKYIKKKTKLKKSFFKRYDTGKEDIYLDAKKCLKFCVCDQIVETTEWRDTLLEQLSKEDCEIIED